MKKGFSLVMLSITISVMLIIAGTIIYSVKKMPDKTNAMVLLDEMKILQAKLYEYQLNHEDNPDKYPYEGVLYEGTIGDITYGQGDYTGYYKLTKKEINNQLNIKSITNDYIVNYSTQDIIYEEGIEIDGSMFYSYDDLYNKLYFNSLQDVNN